MHEVLKNDTDFAAQGIDVVLAEIDSVQQNFAARRLIQARNQLHQGALALAVFAHYGDTFSSSDPQIDVLENQTVRPRVGEGDFAELKAVTNRTGRRYRIHHVAGS